MATPSELQDLLRFLSKDAKLPLATAMSKVKELQKANLTRWVVSPSENFMIHVYHNVQVKGFEMLNS
jgi:hypothetical protein